MTIDQPYMKGLQVYQLPEQELAKYRELQPPKKVKDYTTLAPRRVRGLVIQTNMSNPYGKWARKK